MVQVNQKVLKERILWRLHTQFDSLISHLASVFTLESDDQSFKSVANAVDFLL